MSGNEFIKFSSAKDVLNINVCVDQAEFGTVEGVVESSTKNLEHGSDTSATSDHANFTAELGSVLELTFRTLDSHLVTELEQ